MSNDHGFFDREAAQRQVALRRIEKMEKLISLEIQNKPHVIGEFVEAFHKELLAFVSAGFPLDRYTVKNALQKVRIIYAGRGDVAQDEIAQGSDLSFQIFQTLCRLSGHNSSPSDHSAAELNRLRNHVRTVRVRRGLSAPSNRRAPMNMALSTIDKVRAALSRNVRLGDLCLAAFSAVCIIAACVALLAAGGGQ